MDFIPAVFIGSFPFNYSRALREVAKYSPSIPCLPTTPERQGRLTEIFPGFNDGKVIEDEQFAREVEDLLMGGGKEEGGQEVLEYLIFLNSSIISKGFENRFRKTQIYGPFTFGLTVFNSENQMLCYRHKDLVDFFIADQARKKVRQLAAVEKEAILFLDEPSFTNFGSSALIGLSEKGVMDGWRLAVNAIKEEGGIPGIHVCGNCDWGLALSAGFDIVSFDVKYFENLFAYKRELISFLENGGSLCWGIVPTDELELKRTNAEQLFRKWLYLAVKFGEFGIGFGDIARKSLFSPACGLGTLSSDSALLAMKLTHDVAKELVSAAQD
jgi:hypothetical protein